MGDDQPKIMCVVTERYIDIDGEKVLTYGIMLSVTHHGKEECDRIDNISSKKQEIEKLAELMIRHQVTVITFRDVVEDFILR